MFNQQSTQNSGNVGKGLAQSILKPRSANNPSAPLRTADQRPYSSLRQDEIAKMAGLKPQSSMANSSFQQYGNSSTFWLHD